MSLTIIPGKDAPTFKRAPDSQPEGTALTDFQLSMRGSPPTAFTSSDLRLSAVRLMRDAKYPWLLLVPRDHLAEIIDLMPATSDAHGRDRDGEPGAARVRHATS